MSSLDPVLDELMRRYPDLSVAVHQGESHDPVLIDLEREDRPDIQLIGAEDCAIATAIVGRYTFDNLQVDSLVEFLTDVYELRFSLTRCITC